MISRKKSGEGIINQIAASARTIQGLARQAAVIDAIGRLFVRSLRSGGKILTAGNGGSAAEALHMAEEFVGRYKRDRRPLPAVALVADATVLTCIGNDYGFDHVFSRQVDAMGCKGDVLVLLSTSGRARNLQLALTTARRRGLKTVALLGRDGGALRGQADYEIIVEGRDTERIQEAQLVIVHILLQAVEDVYAQR